MVAERLQPVQLVIRQQRQERQRVPVRRDDRGHGPAQAAAAHPLPQLAVLRDVEPIVVGDEITGEGRKVDDERNAGQCERKQPFEVSAVPARRCRCGGPRPRRDGERLAAFLHDVGESSSFAP